MKRQRREYHREYYHRNRVKRLQQIRDSRTKNPRNHRLSVARYRKRHPLEQRLYRIRERCTNIKCRDFRHYGAKGIKCFLTIQDLEFLWNRDGADHMRHPSIRRLNHSEHYVISNCVFQEWEDHRAIDWAVNRKLRWK